MKISLRRKLTAGILSANLFCFSVAFVALFSNTYHDSLQVFKQQSAGYFTFLAFSSGGDLHSKARGLISTTDVSCTLHLHKNVDIWDYDDFDEKEESCSALLEWLDSGQNTAGSADTFVGADRYIFGGPLGNADSDLFYLQVDASSFSMMLQHLLRMMGLCLIFMLLFSMILANEILFKPLSNIVHSLHQLEEEEYSQRLSIGSEDELGYLGEQFNLMIDKIERREEKIKQAQTEAVAQSKLASIGEMAAGVAHEINNPMAFINSNMKLFGDYATAFSEYIVGLEQRVPELLGQDDLPEELMDLKKSKGIDFIMEELPSVISAQLEGVERVTGIVQALKNFSRVDQDDKDIADINECIASTVRISKSQLPDRTTLVEEYGEIPRTYCYPGKLNQVFLNLIVNAGHAIGDEVGTITVKTAYDEADNVIEISVADTGCGISDENMEKIFNPFFTTKGVGVGTGLGLSVTHGVVEDHNARIDVQTELGEGTTFTIYLPVVAEGGMSSLGGTP